MAKEVSFCAFIGEVKMGNLADFYHAAVAKLRSIFDEEKSLKRKGKRKKQLVIYYTD